MSFKIGSYTIKSREYYNALLDAGITSDSELKKIDKNNDKKISEDELEELLLDEDETEDGEEDIDEEDSGSSSFSMDVADSIALHEEKIRDLMQNLAAACSELGTSADMETFDSNLSNVENIENQIKEHREAIYELLAKEEGGDYSDYGDYGDYDDYDDSSTGSIKSGKSLKSSKGTCSAIAKYALQYNGKGESEMYGIMTGKGYRFNSGLWCADFATFCTKETYGKDALSDCPNTSSCWGIGTWAKSHNVLMDSRYGYKMDLSKVKPGDYIMYNADGGEWYHIGIVSKVNSDGTVDTIEGNTGNGVCGSHSHVSTNNVSFVLVHNVYGSKSKS